MVISRATLRKTVVSEAVRPLPKKGARTTIATGGDAGDAEDEALSSPGGKRSARVPKPSPPPLKREKRVATRVARQPRIAFAAGRGFSVFTEP